MESAGVSVHHASFVFWFSVHSLISFSFCFVAFLNFYIIVMRRLTRFRVLIELKISLEIKVVTFSFHAVICRQFTENKRNKDNVF